MSFAKPTKQYVFTAQYWCSNKLHVYSQVRKQSITCRLITYPLLFLTFFACFLLFTWFKSTRQNSNTLLLFISAEKAHCDTSAGALSGRTSERCSVLVAWLSKHCPVLNSIFLRTWNVCVSLLQHETEPVLGTCRTRLQKSGPEIEKKVNCVRKTITFLREMSVITHSIHCTDMLHVPIDPSSPSAISVSVNNDDTVWEHFHKRHYTRAAQLPHEALRDHAYTAGRSFTYLKLHFFVRTDRRKVPGCLVFIIRAFWAHLFFSDLRSVLEVAAQFLSRVIFRGDENPPFGLRKYLFLSAVGCEHNCKQTIMCPSRTSSTAFHSPTLQRIEFCSTA